MKKILFVIARYKDDRQRIFDEIISPKNEKYCQKHDFKYIIIDNNKELPNFRNNPTWIKLTIIRDLIESGRLQNGDLIINQDADMVWYNDEFSYEPALDKSFAISIDSGNTFCFGSIGVKINDWSKQLIKDILDEDLWNNTKDIVTPDFAFPEKPPFSFASSFREQAMFYYLFGIQEHSWVPFKNLPNNGIHSNVTKFTKYSIEDANKHLDIKPENYNVTCWLGESDPTFNINKIQNKSDVYLRHFTGCDWNVVNNWI